MLNEIICSCAGTAFGFFLGKGFSAVAYFWTLRRRRAYLRPFLLAASESLLALLRELAANSSGSLRRTPTRFSDVSELNLFVSLGVLRYAEPVPIVAGGIYTFYLGADYFDALVDFFAHCADNKQRMKGDNKSASEI